MMKPVLRPLVLAMAGLGAVCGVQAGPTIVTVPPGVTSVSIALKGAGGGGGGADTNGKGGTGAFGASLNGDMPVTPGQTLVLVAGEGGAGADSWTIPMSDFTPNNFGLGGPGDAAGGNGAQAKWNEATNPDGSQYYIYAGSGGGGGGGGASSAAVDGTVVARAAGGGGGGGGSDGRAGGDGIPATASVQTAACANAGVGSVGKPYDPD